MLVIQEPSKGTEVSGRSELRFRHGEVEESLVDDQKVQLVCRILQPSSEEVAMIGDGARQPLISLLPVGPGWSVRATAADGGALESG
ncbi:MAG: hypothetical protein AAF627_09885 [Myxococcota bacterium]